MENKQFCQSCAMPLEGAQDHGTEADGSASADYCKYCYDKGAFTSEQTMEQMVESCIPFLVQAGQAKTEEEARTQMMGYFPMLKRWAK